MGPATSNTPSPVTWAPVTASPVTASPTNAYCLCIQIYDSYCCEQTEEFANDCYAECEGYTVTESCVQGQCTTTTTTTTSSEIVPTNNSGAGAVTLKVVMAVMGMVMIMEG